MIGWVRKLGVFCLIAVLSSGCSYYSSMSQDQQNGLVGGAIAGTMIGGAVGCGIAAGVGDGTSTTDYAIGCPIGAVAGAIIGGFIGYKMVHPAPPPVAAAPPPPPPPPPPPAPAPQERIVLRGVHFDFNRANIRPDAVPILDEAAEILSKHSDVSVDVNGYCDIIGSYRYNLRLSQRRADAVANYLEGKGIAANRLITHGYGKTHFVATNRTGEGRAQNRRVELVPTSS
jgi:outer membrane protein OmpA-like peptidoglycan-associated protein